MRFESCKFVKIRLQLRPDPAGGAYSAPHTPSWIWGEDGRVEEEEKAGRREWRVEAERMGKGRIQAKILATTLSLAYHLDDLG